MLWQAAEELRALRSYTGAIQAYERIAALSPTDPAPLVAVGYIYLAQQEWLLATDAFNRALARRIDFGSAWTGLASASWARGDLHAAVTQWQTALEYQPDMMQARLGLALGFIYEGQLHEAATTLAAGVAMLQSGASLPIEQSGAMASAYLLRGAILALESPVEARRELSLIADNAPQETLVARNHLVEALDRAAAADTPAQATKYIGLAIMKAELWPLARLALMRAYSLQPDDAETVASLGYVEAMMGLDRPAWEHLSTAVVLRPQWSLARLWLGRYCLQNGLLYLSIAQLRMASALELSDTTALLELSRAYVSLGNYAQAEQALLAAVERAPYDLDVRLALVNFYADSLWHVADRGLAAAKSAAEMAPQDARVRDMLGWMYLLAGDMDQARLHLFSALALKPDQASTYYHLGKFYLALGFQDHARTAFCRAVDLDSTGQLRPRALRSLTQLNQTS